MEQTMRADEAGLTTAEMRSLVERHMAAEAAGDIDGAVAVYTDDVEHDMVGAPAGPLRGPAVVRPFYEDLTSNLTTIDAQVTQEYYGADFCMIEHLYTAVVNGEFLGVPGNGRRVSFRMLHVFEFRGRLISRENVWLDSGTIIAHLTA